MPIFASYVIRIQMQQNNVVALVRPRTCFLTFMSASVRDSVWFWRWVLHKKLPVLLESKYHRHHWVRLYLHFLEHFMLCLVLLYKDTKDFLRIWPFLGYHSVGWPWTPTGVTCVQTRQMFLESWNTILSWISNSCFPRDSMLPGVLPDRTSLRVVPLSYSPFGSLHSRSDIKYNKINTLQSWGDGCTLHYFLINTFATSDFKD